MQILVHRQTGKQADKQTDRQATDRQAIRQTDAFHVQTNGCRDRIEKQTDGHTERKT